MDSREWVFSKFSEYYRNPTTKISQPILTDQREFAYLMFRERFMVRHKRFDQIETFQKVLAQTIPSDVYHSCAYYENPDFDMDKKGWIGSDLVFDIDADHLNTPCNKIHDEFTCASCGFSGKGLTPEACPACEGIKFQTKTWPCDLCIQTAREETSKLLDMLLNDFGFANDELHVFFSGHRGYHVHVEAESIRTLDAMARKEIVDYVTGLGLDLLESPKERKDPKGKKPQKTPFRLHDFGWNRRLKIGMQNLIRQASKEDLKQIGLTSPAANAIIENRAIVLKNCLTQGLWGSIPNVSDGTWKKIALHVKNLQASQIDTVVTTDIHRLIRMNGTLHGKTGLKKVEFPVKDLNVFDPFNKAVAFTKGTMTVEVSDAPEFRLLEQTFGPYKNTNVELPTAAAVMLICKGRAKVTE